MLTQDSTLVQPSVHGDESKLYEMRDGVHGTGVIPARIGGSAEESIDSRRPSIGDSSISHSSGGSAENNYFAPRPTIFPSYNYFYPQSPSTSYASSPETLVSFVFSPTTTQQAFQSKPGFLARSRGRQDSVDTAMTSASTSYGVASPCTSYASSSMATALVPLNDDGAPISRDTDNDSDSRESYEGKGKGKGKDQHRRGRSPSPLPSPPQSITELPLTQSSEDLLGLSFTEDGGVIFKASSMETGLSQAPSLPHPRPTRSRIGLSFAAQRFTFASPTTTFSSLVTPYPDGTFAPKSPPGSTPISTLKSRHRKSPRPALLSLLGRRKSKKEAGKKRVLEVDPVVEEVDAVGHAGVDVTTNATTRSNAVSDTSTGDAEGSDMETSQISSGSSSSGSATIQCSALTTSLMTIRQNSTSAASGKTKDQAEGSVIVYIEPENPSSSHETNENSIPAIVPDPAGPSLLTTGSPSTLAATLPPPRLRFVGRANTAPAIAFAQVTSEVAEGTSSRPLTPNPQTSSTPASSNLPRTPLPRHTSDSTLTTISSPDSSNAYTYVYTLPPLPRIDADKSSKPLNTNSAARKQLRSLGAAKSSAVDVSSPINEVEDELLTPPVEDNYFNHLLPYELQIEVFQELLWLHVYSQEKLEESNDWSVGVASGGFSASSKHAKEVKPSARWVGFESGVRELVKIGRVSRSWRQLSLDGQLWSTTSFAPFPHIPIPFLERITKSIGPFMRTLNLSGVSGITPPVLMNIVENLGGQTKSAEAGNSHQPGDHTFSYFMASSLSARQGINTRQELQPSSTQLTSINLKGCSAITTRSLHHLLIASPQVQDLTLTGLSAVTNTTCEIIGEFCSANLVKLDLSRCWNMNGNGVQGMIGHQHIEALGDFAILPSRRLAKLRTLRLGGLRRTSISVMYYIGYGLPDLEMLDLSGSKYLRDEEVEAMVDWDDRYDDPSVSNSSSSVISHPTIPKISLTSREMGLNPMNASRYHKRLTKLRHISFSSCPLVTDACAGHLAYTVPNLEFFELGGVGASIRDAGLVRLFGTTPLIRKIDLEDASEITDETLDALSPPPPPPLVDRPRLDTTTHTPTQARAPPPPCPGDRLEHIVVSYAGNISDQAFLSLIRSCPKLTTLEADNTRISDNVVKEFVKTCRRRAALGAEIVAVDCRNVTRGVVGGENGQVGNNGEGVYATRNRRGIRSWESRAMGYYDERDGKDLMSGNDVIGGALTVGDECDDKRVVLKTFHTWQAVDAMMSARERRRKVIASRKTGESTSGRSSPGDGASSPRWLNWRSASVVGVPLLAGEVDMEDERGCVIM